MLRYRSKNFPSSRSEQNEKIASKLSNALSWTVNTTYLGFAVAPVRTSVLYIAITNQVSSRVSTQHTAWQFSDIAFSYRLELFLGGLRHGSSTATYGYFLKFSMYQLCSTQQPVPPLLPLGLLFLPRLPHLKNCKHLQEVRNLLRSLSELLPYSDRTD